MKLTIDLEDFYQDEDESLKESLSRYITSCVIDEIWKRIKFQVDVKITEVVVDKVSSDLEPIITQRMDELLSSGEIIKHSKPMKITDHITSIFMEHSGWSNPNDFITRRAKEVGAELKARYDVAFATAIVMNLNQNGMLKEEISKMMLESPTKS